jgi:putative membrane protein
MTATQGDLASLSRYIFRAPRWHASLAFALVVAAVAGVGVFNNTYLLEDAWQGIFFVGVPTVAASFLTSSVDRSFGGQLTPNRSSLLALVCEVFVVTVLVGAGVVAALTPLGQNFVFDVFLAALAAIFAFRLLVLMAVSGHRILTASVPASIQTGVAAVMLFVYSGAMRYFAVDGRIVDAFLSRQEQAPPELNVVVPGDFGVLLVICVVYGGAVYAFVRIIDRPWQRSLGVSVLDFLGGFIGHIADGTRELEDFFEEIGEEAVVPVTVCSVRRPDGDEKARFVLPMIHPGPMGEIGGGNLPVRVARQAEGLGFPPHATAGHDFNLVTEREVDTVLDAADRAMANVEYTDRATRSVRVDEGDASLLAQAVGGDLLSAVTYSPSFADDVSYAVGLAATAEARSGGIDDVLLADAHNCNNGLQGDDLGHVTPGSERAFDTQEAAARAGETLADASRAPLRVGVAWDETPWDPEDGIGPLGVRVAVFEVDDQRTAYVLIDGNNMEPDLRDRLVAGVSGVDRVEILTTDTHVVNQVEATNQVGEAISDGKLLDLINRLVDDAVDDVEPVEAGMASEHAAVTVFGNDRTETLASTANAMVSMGGGLAAATTLVAMIASVLIFLLA